MIVWPSANRHSSTCGLIVVRVTPGVRARPAMSISLSKCPMLPTIAWCLVRPSCSAEMMSLFPVGGDDDVGLADHLVEGGHLVAVHRRLQRADRVDLGDDHAGALAAERLRAALADVAVAADDGDLAADHHVGRAVDAVDQRVPAAVEVVELALGDRVVDVDRREEQPALAGELVEPHDAGRGLLGDALDALADAGPALRRPRRGCPRSTSEDDLVLVGVGVDVVGDDAVGLEAGAQVHQQRGVAAVVEEHVRPDDLTALVAELEQPLGAPPVLLQRLALPGEDRHAGGLLGRAVADDDRGGGVVLGGEDVAADPADVGAQRGQRLDEDGGLHGHVQRAGDAGAGQRLLRRRTRRAGPSGRASRARRAGSPCGRSRRGRGRRP